MARTSRAGAAQQHERIVAALVAAAESRDGRGVGRMLHPGVRLTVDGGGVVPAPSTALDGASEVGAHLVGVLLDPLVALRIESVNGVPGIVLCRQGRVAGVLSIRVRGRLVVEAWLVVNPQKLTGWSC